MREFFKMGSSFCSTEFSSNKRDNASALVFLEPGIYVTEKSNRVKNNAYLACLGFSLLGERIYSKFLWSVITVNLCFALTSIHCSIHSSIAAFIARSS